MNSFNLENKITWEELAPSLQELFKTLQSQITNLPDVIINKIETDLKDPDSNLYKSFQTFTQTIVNNDINDPTSTIYNSLTKATTTIINNSTSDPDSGIYKSLQTYIDNQISQQLQDSDSSIYNSMQSYMEKYLNNYFSGGTDGTENGTGYKRIKQLMFTNLPPKIGFLDETTANISGAFNMSSVPMYNKAWWITSDIEGREVYYFRGYNEVGATVKIYRCYRSSLTDMSSFIFDNDPVCPIGLGEDYYMDDIIGITNSYIIAHCTNGSKSGWYKIDTKYSSNVKNWTNYKNIDKLLNNVTGVNQILYFDTYNGTKIDRYLVLNTKNNYTYLSIVDSNFNLLSEQEIFCPMDPVPHSSVYDGGNASFSFGYYSYAFTEHIEGVVCAYMAYIEDEDNELNRLVVWIPLNGSVWRDKHYKYINQQMDYVDWIQFKPTNLLSTSNYFNQKFRWHLGRDTFADYGKSNRWGGDGTYTLFEAWLNGSLSYDSLNKYLYVSRTHRDELNNHINRIPLAALDWDDKGGALFYTGVDANFRLNTPDTSPWAKKHYGPSVIYDGVYLCAESVSRGMNLKNFASTGTMHTAVVPKQINGTNKVGVTAGTWVVRYYGTWPSGQQKPKTVIDNSESNCNWCAWQARYSETKEPFTSPDKCSFYDLGADNNNIYVYRLYHSPRRDRNNIVRNDLLNLNTTPVCTFKRPSIGWGWFPKGLSWAYRSSKFGGKDQLIIVGWNDERHCTKDSSGNWKEDNPDAIPYIVILNTDGTYLKLRNTDTDYRNIWFGFVSDTHPILRYPDLCNGNFLDDDGKTFYCNFHFRTSDYNGNWDHLSYKVEFTLDSSNNINGFKTPWSGANFSCNGQWHGQESLGWVRTIGYFKTLANYSGISYIFYSSTSMEKALGNEHCMFLTNTGTTGLVANLQTTPIYLGGYYSLIPAQEIDLKPNSHNYIYLFRNPTDPDAVTVEVYDKLLGGDDRDIHFARILVADIETDSEGPIKQTSYKTVNYGTGTGLS